MNERAERSRTSLLAGGALFLALALVGCGTDPVRYLDSPDGGSTGPGPGPGGASGLPCDVANLLQAHCTTCHGTTPSGGAPISLMSYNDLMAKSAIDPSKRVADRALTRMQDTATPMPPLPAAPVSQAEIGAFQAWLTAGAAMGTCGTIQDPFGAVPVCTSMQTWRMGGESALMNPGEACITCHKTNREAPTLLIAGTVYPSGHEPDLCLGSASSGATVVATDSKGIVLTLTVNANGNFSQRASNGVTFTPPYTAKVTFQGRMRAMSASQTTGDCNSCHTQNGANNAPGRIVLP